MDDLRLSPVKRSLQYPHRLPGPKYSNRDKCSLCTGPNKDEHDEYVCGGCLNLFDDIEAKNSEAEPESDP